MHWESLSRKRDNQRLGCGLWQPSRMASCFIQRGRGEGKVFSKTKLLPYPPKLCTDFLGVFFYRLRHIAVRTDRHMTFSEDAGLLESDLLACVAQIIGVIDVHTGPNPAVTLH